MSKTLKLEISVADLDQDWGIVSEFATTDFVQTELNKKVSLTLEGKVDSTQLPDFTYIDGLQDALEDESLLRASANSDA